MPVRRIIVGVLLVAAVAAAAAAANLLLLGVAERSHDPVGRLSPRAELPAVSPTHRAPPPPPRRHGEEQEADD